MGTFYGFEAPAGPTEMWLPGFNGPLVTDIPMHDGTSVLRRCMAGRSGHDCRTNIEIWADNRGVPSSREGHVTRELRQLGCSIATEAEYTEK